MSSSELNLMKGVYGMYLLYEVYPILTENGSEGKAKV